MNASEVLKGFAMKQVYGYLDKDPDTNIPKLLDMLEKYDKSGQAITSQVEGIRAALADPNNNWSKLVKSLWTDIDDEQRKKLVETVAINGTLIGTPASMKLQDKYQCNIPWAILMDPTSACNLHCTGCWAAEYGNKLNLTFEQLDDVIRQGKELGTYVYIYSGGEPLVRKADLIRLCEKHSDCAFLAFTNGTVISTPTAIWNPVHSFIILIPTSRKRRCWSATSPRCLWLIAAISRSMKICCAPVLCWITPVG